jgi:hypothetical protein
LDAVRVDEVSGPNTVEGDVWSFTTWLDLVSLWKLDEGTGLTAYDSARDNDGNLINGPVWSSSGINGSLEFDGNEGYVQVSSDSSLNVHRVTMCAWVKVNETGPGTNNFIINRKMTEPGTYGLLVRASDNRLRAQVRLDGSEGTGRIITSNNPVSSDWIYVCGVYDGDKLKMYVDGVLQDEINDANGNIDTDNPRILTIGAHPDHASYFNGLIDEVRIYDRALSAEEIDELYAGNSPVYYVDGVDGNDLNDGLTPETAFATIQMGIDTAEDHDTVLVLPDTYIEELDFNGKAITVTSFDEPAVLSAPDFYAVKFIHGEGPDSVVKNFIIKNSYAAVLCVFASPTISNVTVVDCNNGVIADEGADPLISNSIFWNNSGVDLSACEAIYSFVEDNSYGSPLFVDPNNGDYRLKSEGWRCSASIGGWTRDSVTSPCVDYGNPGTPLDEEPLTLPIDQSNTWGQSVRVNMGAYGRTSQASMAPIGWAQLADSNDDGAQSLAPPGWALLADLNNDGMVNLLDARLGSEYWLSSGADMPGDLNRDGIVNLVDYALFALDYGKKTSWRE